MRKGQNPRLQFTDAEREDSRLKEHIRHADQAADKAEAARAKISKKKKKVKQRTVDPATGKKKTQLRFEEVDKPAPASKLTHAVTAAPGKTISSQVHKKIGETEEDNVGVQSVHQVEEAAESGVHMAQSAYRSHKLRPYRAAARAERKLEKANVNALYQKSLAENPALSSNPISRWQQKQAIKKQYAAAKRTGQSANAAAKAAENTAKATKKAAEETKKAGGFVWRHRRGFGIVLALFLMVCAFANGLSSCSVLLQGGLSGVAGSTYPCRDEDMLGAEDAYAQMEADLQYELDHYESIHSGYDEYHYDLDEIEHDPYVLMSILTAYHQGEWTLSQVQGTLAMLFDKQYTLTETVVVETRYRTETSTDPETGETTSEEVPYDYYICYVTLDNFDLSHLPVYIMGEDQVSMYAVYMATLGNRPDLFPQSEYPNASTRQDYLDYDVPPEALEDEVFAAMLAEAEKYLGYPYVWGGSSPSTSFDCSGFVSWVINHSGWDVGRLGAQGLCNICTPVSSANAKPGDLIFFKGTYDTPGVSHVGIYVGNGMMIHCGSPISYASINTSYWQSHFYQFGRLP
ncbi:C40 family peptidase [Lachnospiraceae bacterium CLA-AA-H58]|uniref:C40 family peptidase n=1 Tax=Pilosibacter fragilis TaxID=3078042 RepID=UPI0032D27784